MRATLSLSVRVRRPIHPRVLVSDSNVPSRSHVPCIRTRNDERSTDRSLYNVHSLVQGCPPSLALGEPTQPSFAPVWCMLRSAASRCPPAPACPCRGCTLTNEFDLGARGSDAVDSMRAGRQPDVRRQVVTPSRLPAPPMGCLRRGPRSEGAEADRWVGLPPKPAECPESATPSGSTRSC